MALRINTNVSALNAHKNMINNDNKLSSSLERLSTGLRINKAADDASGMIIADSLKAQHMGIGQAIRNANDGISIVQTADGALQESINIINTIKTKAIQAASDGQTSKTRTAIQNDINKLMEELDVIAKTTSFNGQKLLSGAFSNKSFQIGAFSRETANISIGSTESTKMGHITTSNLSLAGDGGEVQLTITSSLTGEQLTLNELDIQKNNDAENGMGALADEINRYTSATGIKANAVVSTTTQSAIVAGSTGSDFAINGITIGAITATNNDSNGALVTAINGKTAEHGVTAAMEEDGRLTLTSSDGRALDVTGSISSVFASTADQMSTYGHIQLSQSGVSQFEINGIGGGATGADIVLDIGEQLVTVQDSNLAASSVLAAGTMLSAGSVIGGDALVEATVEASQLDYELKTGSVIAWGSDIDKGTTLGAQITVGGELVTSGAANQKVTIDQDMLVTSGSKLVANSVIGAGTLVTTAFQSGAGGTTYAVGDTLSAAVTLGSDITLQADMSLKYDSNAGDNSAVGIKSTLAAGSVLGADFNNTGMVFATDTAGGDATALGVTYMGGTAAATSEGTATTVAGYVETAVVATVGDVLVKAGSMLASGTTLTLATGAAASTSTWTGATLVTTAGTIETGDTINNNTVYTLSGAQRLSEDLTSYANADTSTTTSIAAGSLLTSGFNVTDAATAAVAGQTTGALITVDTLSDATLSQDMILKSGSTLETGSKLVAGSKVGDSTYIMGGELNASRTTMTTYQTTDLQSGSQLVSVTGNTSTLAEGSTVGGNLKLNVAETLTSDMTLKTGTLLKSGTVLEAGTVINQEIQFNEATDPIAAGTKLSQDMTLTNDVTLTTDMTAKKDTVIALDSVIAVNTENQGSVGLSDTASYKLSDLSVLTQEGAQRAIDIAEAALEALDNTRAGLGSVQNQFVSTISNLSVTKTNIQASESAIRDVDFAEESMNFAKLQLLAQTGSYALAQANASSQNIMSLLQ